MAEFRPRRVGRFEGQPAASAAASPQAVISGVEPESGAASVLVESGGEVAGTDGLSGSAESGPRSTPSSWPAIRALTSLGRSTGGADLKSVAENAANPTKAIKPTIRKPANACRRCSFKVSAFLVFLARSERMTDAQLP